MGTDYISMTAEARFAAIETMAREIFGPKWKGQLAAHYGLTGQTITSWKLKGAPSWAAVACADLYRADLTERALAAKPN